jgi:regulator of sirC expression with transglutaminase-like and TPR domain
MLELSPDDPSAYVGLGTLYYELEQYEAALDHLQRYVELAGDDADDWILDLIDEIEAQLNAS